MDETLSPPLLIAPRNGLPLLLSIPHSGRDYPDWLVAEARHGRAPLTSLEDPLVDRLAWRAIAAGFGAVVARTPRAAIDCNRSPGEVDPAAIRDVASAPVGPRARNGLGIIPARAARHGLLWKRALSQPRFEARLQSVHRPYHDMVEQQLVALSQQHPTIVLLDLHSMPPRGPAAAPIVIGNRHMTSSAEWIAHEAMAISARRGFPAALNSPYAGGHIVERHGRPASGVHALQIEIDRSAYLAADLSSAGTGFDRVSKLIEGLAMELAATVTRDAAALAAE